MALQTWKDDVEWKPGKKCDLFDRDTLKWIEAEVIGSFSDDKGEWIRGRYGNNDRNVLTIDPDL